MNDVQLMIHHLAVALTIGLLIGIERGWKERRAAEGERVAGVRTFALLGLFGGVAALLGDRFGALLIGLIFLGLAGLLGFAYFQQQERDDDAGMTSLIASLLTFLLAALAASGEAVAAVAASVVTMLILNQKPLLHRWIRALRPGELRSGILLLLISAVALPVLPDHAYGPYQALNPYEIWWMVVLIATISFVGYFAIKIGGTRNGVLFTGIFGGFAASTAVTLHFARMARREPVLAPVLATGTLLACGTMLPRMLLVTGLINPALLPLLAGPVLLMSLPVYLPALVLLRQAARVSGDIAAPLRSPLELRTALLFGLLLALVLLLGRALQAGFGNAGVLALAAASGVADVDAIALSLAHMGDAVVALKTAVAGLVIAAATNTLAKGVLAVAIGGSRNLLRVGLPLGMSAVVGYALTWWNW